MLSCKLPKLQFFFIGRMNKIIFLIGSFNAHKALLAQLLEQKEYMVFSNIVRVYSQQVEDSLPSYSMELEDDT